MKLKHFLSATLILVSLVLNAEPKYIFYFIGDGMGIVPLMAAQEMNRTVYNGERPLTMLQFPVSSF